MRKLRALYGWLLLGGLLGCSALTGFTGCGGSGSSPLEGLDSSTDSAGEADGSSSGGDSAQAADAPEDTGLDTGVNSSDGGDASGDTGTSSDAGDTGSDSSEGDARAEAGEGDARAEAGDSGTGAEAGDGSPGPCPTGSACSIGAVDGVCVGAVCAPCHGGGSSAGTDTACTSAYGNGSNPYVCVSGSCAPGDCTAASACAAPTPTCGFSTPNFCGGCTGDSECPSTKICDTKASSAGKGTCVAASAGGCTANQSDAVCPLNASDECCSGSCYPGNCCIAAGVGSGCTGAGVACASQAPGETLGGGVCTTCASVSGANPVYFVDPVHGSDASGTGNNSTSPQCAFRTISRALQFVGTSPQPNTTIDVVGAPGGVTIRGVASGTPSVGEELFPLTIRSNITVKTSGGPVTIRVAAPGGGVAQTTGFILSGNPSAIEGGAALTIDGQAHTATTGVAVQSTGASLSAVTIQNFARDGIDVADVGSTPSTLAVGQGVQSNGNNVDGLLVSGSSSATVTGSDGAPTEFNANGAHGIRVIGTGVISVLGTVGTSPPTGSTVIAAGNGQAGLWVQTTSSTQSSVTGLTSTGSTAGNGIRIIPGSNVKLRRSWVLGNAGDGIDIENIGGGTAATVANIDLGTAASAGGNVVQSVSGANPNAGAGICLRLPAGSAVALRARGNIFQNGANCASAASVLKTAANRACGNGEDVGGTIVAFPGGTGNTIDVTMCSYP